MCLPPNATNSLKDVEAGKGIAEEMARRNLVALEVRNKRYWSKAPKSPTIDLRIYHEYYNWIGGVVGKLMGYISLTKDLLIDSVLSCISSNDLTAKEWASDAHYECEIVYHTSRCLIIKEEVARGNINGYIIARCSAGTISRVKIRGGQAIKQMLYSWNFHIYKILSSWEKNLWLLSALKSHQKRVSHPR